jgi:hypothetical protein
MGWTTLENGEFSGDLPLDAFAAALDRTAKAYRERFGRLPRLREVLHALRIVVQAAPYEYLDDPWLVAGDWLPTIPPGDRPPLLVDDFQAAWQEDPQPDGTYLVRRGTSGPDVLTCTLAQSERTLLISYQILDPDLSDDDARGLIAHVLLKDFANDYYAPLTDQIAFRNGADPSSPPVTTPYPR